MYTKGRQYLQIETFKVKNYSFQNLLHLVLPQKSENISEEFIIAKNGGKTKIKSRQMTLKTVSQSSQYQGPERLRLGRTSLSGFIVQ